MELEHKRSPLDVKQVAADGRFEGYAAFFGNVDAYGDVIEKGAFAKSLEARKAAGKTIPALWQHDTREPIGAPEEIREDHDGLYVKGLLLIDGVQRSREAFELLKAGVVTGMSIGYWARDYSVDEKTGIRTLKEIDLEEISLVTFPANDRARVTGVKAIGDRAADRSLLHMIIRNL